MSSENRTADEYLAEVIANTNRSLAEAERWNRIARIALIVCVVSYAAAIVCAVIAFLVS